MSDGRPIPFTVAAVLKKEDPVLAWARVDGPVFIGGGDRLDSLRSLAEQSTVNNMVRLTVRDCSVPIDGLLVAADASWLCVARPRKVDVLASTAADEVAYLRSLYFAYRARPDDVELSLTAIACVEHALRGRVE